jgi:hypothetical protein
MTLNPSTSQLTRPAPTGARTPEYDAIVVDCGGRHRHAVGPPRPPGAPRRSPPPRGDTLDPC